MQEVEQDLRDQIKDLIRSKKYDELEETWLKIVEGEPHSLSFHQSVARYLINRKELDRLATLYNILLTQRNKDGQHALVLEIGEMLLEFDPTLQFLRPHLIDAVKGRYADRDPQHVAEYIRLSGLGSETPNLKQSLERVEDLAGASVGQVFRHSMWGLGVVKELDARQGWAVLDFPKKKNHRMTLDGIKNFLKRIPDDHIQARMAKEPEAFKAEMFSDHAAAARLALRSLGGKLKVADLKKLLLDGFMTEAEWKRWWTKAKDEVRLDPYVDSQGTGVNVVLSLRKEPRSFVDEILTKFLQAKSLQERREVLREISRHGDKADMTPEDVTALYKLYRKPVDEGLLKSDQDLFGHGLLFEEYSDLMPDDATNPINVEQYLTDPGKQPGKMIIALGVYELQRLALEHVLRLREQEAEDIFAEVFNAADSRLATWMEKALADKGKQGVLEHCLERILAHPERNPDMFAYAGRQVIDGLLPHVAESISPMMICEQAASMLSIMEERARETTGEEQKQAKNIGNKMRTILQEQHHKYLKKAIRQSTPEQARHFLSHISLLGGLPNQLKSTMEDLVHYEQPDLRAGKAQAEQEATMQFHYATAESVEQKRRELSHIVQVEIPENSKAIGIARELGDLRENAEYHAAKDRQKLLMQQAKELEELIGMARIISPDQIRTDSVRFGTTVTLKRKDNGNEEKYTLVGMWEADARSKISYLTPFGSQLMNRKPNEQFEITLPDGSTVGYIVTSIEKGI